MKCLDGPLGQSTGNMAALNAHPGTNSTLLTTRRTPHYKCQFHCAQAGRFGIHFDESITDHPRARACSPPAAPAQ